MPVERSHGKPRPATYRADELHRLPPAITARDRDPHTGRFVPGNTASRCKTLKRLARELPWLDPEKAEGWLKPYAKAAGEHALALRREVPLSDMVSPLADELAVARVVFRAFIQAGMAGDREALREARHWLRECRQHALVLEGVAREHGRVGGRGTPVADIERRTAELLAQGSTLDDEETPQEAPEGANDPAPVHGGEDAPASDVDRRHASRRGGTP